MTYIPGGGGGGSIATSSDVALNNPTDGQALMYDETNAKWQNSTVEGGAQALDDIGDVDASSPFDNDVITFDEPSGSWVPRAPQSIASIDASQVASGTFSLDRAPAGSVFNYDKQKGGFGTPAGQLPSARPSVRTDITFVWTSDVDPSAIAIAGDKWDRY